MKVINATEAYLHNGISVIIDRCNYNQEQRSYWIEIAKRNGDIPIFCLVLPYANDVDMCLDRAKSRDGSNWSRIIKPMAKKYEEPMAENEEFSHIFYCSSDNDTQNALQALKQL